MTDLVVAKFGGTSVADFDAMNRSVDVALLDANTRVVVLSASAGVTNLLVALAEGLEPGERFAKLDAMRQIQFNILERLRYPNVIRDEIERLLENITTLAEAASLASSTALTDELVSPRRTDVYSAVCRGPARARHRRPVVRRAAKYAHQRPLWPRGTGYCRLI